MAKLPTDEIRSTLHVERELNDEFLKACEKKFGKKFKKKSAYTELMRKFVAEMNVNGKDDTETPTSSTEIESTPESKPESSQALVISNELSQSQREELVKKLAKERKKQELIANPPPPFPVKLPSATTDDISSFLSHVPRDRKIKITRIEID